MPLPFPRPLHLIVRLALVALAGAFLWLALINLVSLRLYGMTTTAEGGTRENRRALLDQALAVNPDLGWGWFQRAQLELDSGNLAAARTAIDEAVRVHTRYEPYQLRAQILFALCQGFMGAGGRVETLNACEAALAIHPLDWVVLNRAATLALQNQDTARARDYLIRFDHFEIRGSDPAAQNVETTLLWAQVAEIEEDFDLARDLCARALLFDPESGPATLQMAQLLRDHFEGTEEQAYEILRDGWRPGLRQDYLQHLGAWALERHDLDTALVVLGDLWVHRAALGGQLDVDSTRLLAILERTMRQELLQRRIRPEVSETVGQFFQRIDEWDDPAPIHEALVERIIWPTARGAISDRDTHLRLSLLDLLYLQRQSLDEPNPALDERIDQLIGSMGVGAPER